MASAGFAVFEGDKLVRFVGTVRDITDQHRVEAALRESERRFATLAEGSPVLLWVNGLEGGEFVNRAYLEFLGAAVQPGGARLRVESVLASGGSR